MLPVSFEVKVEVSKEATDKLIDSLTDTFSPVTEWLGSVGDSVRIARARTAIAFIEEGGRRAKAAGFRLKAPPLKFMIPYLEAASLEDEADETLASLWANLLVAAGTDYKEFHNTFISILKELGPQSTLVLGTVVAGHYVHDLSLIHDLLVDEEFLESEISGMAENAAWESASAEFDKSRDHGLLHLSKPSLLLSGIIGEIEYISPQPLVAHSKIVHPCTPKPFDQLCSRHSRDVVIQALGVLERQQLVRTERIQLDVDGFAVVKFDCIRTTQLARALLRSCVSPSAVQTRRPRFVRLIERAADGWPSG